MIDLSFQKTISLKSGKEILLRYPQPGDIDKLLAFVNEIAKEDTFVTIHEPKTYEEELDWLVAMIKKIRASKELQIIAVDQDQIIGTAGVHQTEVRSEHLGLFGIMIAKEYRGQGLGRQLMQEVLQQAKDILGTTMVILSIYAPNGIACSLYQSLGFKENGRLPKAVQYKGELIDKILMYKNL